PVTAGPVGPASAAPPGGEQQSGCLSLCRMAASPYPAYGSAGERGTRRPGKRSAAGRSTSERVPVFMPDGGFALSGLRSSR
ncbi:hypothetical protein, partial [Klebsiella pneumoniae]|uniref:hypothetical protein n=5 Tax=Klebsiella pneumoniae TaxID=573 RepID=UPI001C6F906F